MYNQPKLSVFIYFVRVCQLNVTIDPTALIFASQLRFETLTLWIFHFSFCCRSKASVEQFVRTLCFTRAFVSMVIQQSKCARCHIYVVNIYPHFFCTSLWKYTFPKKMLSLKWNYCVVHFFFYKWMERIRFSLINLTNNPIIQVAVKMSFTSTPYEHIGPMNDICMNFHIGQMLYYIHKL